MAQRYDVMIFGASGFTGQYVVEEVARVADEEAGLTWALAGRSMEKLQKVLERASRKIGKEFENIPIVIADVDNYSSLVEMAEKSKIVLNCVGPYRFFGENVVKACIEGGASQIDISGEPQFLEKMQLLYHGKAREAGIYVIGSCGFDSIPSEMGMQFTKSKFDGDLNSIEAFFDVTSGPEGNAYNYGTFESAVHGIAASGELPALRKSLFPNPLPKSNHKLEKRSILFHNDVVDRWCLPFPGSDRSVAVRTQRYNYDVKKIRPIQYMTHICRPSRFSALLMILFAAIFGIFSKFSLTRMLLLNWPALFTFGVFKKGGPSPSQIENSSFSTTFVGEGYSEKLSDLDAQHENKPDKKIITKVIGPEAGYIATPICLVQCAITILKEKGKMPEGGGVYTPGAAFQDTTLIDRLQKHKIQFDVIKSE